jgi:cytochrome b561
MMATVPEAAPQEPVRRYSNVAVTFHWVTVVLVVIQATLGFTFDNSAPGPNTTELFTWHKTIGPVILLVTLARLWYRLRNPPPPFTPELPQWERTAATWNHRLFYFLLIVMPLAGLTAVSGAESGPFTRLAFGIPFPLIPGVSKELGETAGDLHVVMAFILVAAILVHVAAALKQQFFDHWRVAGRMPPFHAPSHEHAVIGQGHRAHPLAG